MFFNWDFAPAARERFFHSLEGVFQQLAVGQTPHRIIDEDKALTFRLMRYGKAGLAQEAVFIIPHIINRPYILDLSDDLSVVKSLLNKGFTVYMIDWGYPTAAQRDISFADYLAYADKCMDIIRRAHHGRKISLLGYCTGGIMSLIYSSFHPEKVARIVLLATPLDFSDVKDIRISCGRMLDMDFITELFANMPGEMVVLFGRNMFFYYLPLFMRNEEFKKELAQLQDWGNVLRINRWLLDSPMIPGAAYTQFMRDCYRNNSLIQNKMKIGKRVVNLARISCPVLNCLAKFDHIVPLASATALKNVYTGGSYEEIIFPSSHVGLTVGQLAHEQLWPKIGEWLKVS